MNVEIGPFFLLLEDGEEAGLPVADALSQVRLGSVPLGSAREGLNMGPAEFFEGFGQIVGGVVVSITQSQWAGSSAEGLIETAQSGIALPRLMLVALAHAVIVVPSKLKPTAVIFVVIKIILLHGSSRGGGQGHCRDGSRAPPSRSQRFVLGSFLMFFPPLGCPHFGRCLGDVGEFVAEYEPLRREGLPRIVVLLVVVSVSVGKVLGIGEEGCGGFVQYVLPILAAILTSLLTLLVVIALSIRLLLLGGSVLLFPLPCPPHGVIECLSSQAPIHPHHVPSPLLSLLLPGPFQPFPESVRSFGPRAIDVGRGPVVNARGEADGDAHPEGTGSDGGRIVRIEEVPWVRLLFRGNGSRVGELDRLRSGLLRVGRNFLLLRERVVVLLLLAVFVVRVRELEAHPSVVVDVHAIVKVVVRSEVDEARSLVTLLPLRTYPEPGLMRSSRKSPHAAPPLILSPVDERRPGHEERPVASHVALPRQQAQIPPIGVGSLGEQTRERTFQGGLIYRRPDSSTTASASTQGGAIQSSHVEPAQRQVVPGAGSAGTIPAQRLI
mmetsp:Transcript_28584/g.84176  ORF Transcript_28584/g.84176 Transcript_28584/m.84176 type:complete len:551 (-) Transcript_28584:561-2213(-)